MKHRPPGRYPKHRPPRGGARAPSPPHAMARPSAGDSRRPVQCLRHLSSCRQRRLRRRRLRPPCAGFRRALPVPVLPLLAPPATALTHGHHQVALQRGFCSLSLISVGHFWMDSLDRFRSDIKLCGTKGDGYCHALSVWPPRQAGSDKRDGGEVDIGRCSEEQAAGLHHRGIYYIR